LTKDIITDWSIVSFLNIRIVANQVQQVQNKASNRIVVIHKAPELKKHFFLIAQEANKSNNAAEAIAILQLFVAKISNSSHPYPI
jgi:hypothetical protein